MLSALIGLLIFGWNEPEIVYASEPEEPKVVLIEVDTALREELKPICACESTGNKNNEPKHYDQNGSVLRGVINNDDVGMCQINLHYHQASAEKMGINLLSEQGNKKYANHLFDTQGSQPWSASRNCWNK